MRFLATCLFCLAALAMAIGYAAEGQSRSLQDKDAEQIAKTWLASLSECNTAVSTSLSDVPFSIDNKRTVNSLTELRHFFDKVAEKKGRREITPESIQIESPSPERIEVTFIIADQEVVVCVRPGDAPRVVGFTDGPAS